MSEVTPGLAADVVAACQAGAEEAADALSRSLDGQFTLSVGEAGSYPGGAALDGFGGPGLVVYFKFGEIGFGACLPESSGMLPEWYANPDPTGESKLSTLAQELSMLLVPESLMADSFEAVHIDQLGAALAAAQVADDAALVPLQIGSGSNSAQMSLIWPLASPDSLKPTKEPEAVAESVVIPANPVTSSGPRDFTSLPPYSRSLLKVKVPVHVVLASKKERIGEVIELAPGSIIKFDKSCEQMLHLYVGNQVVAEGEAVKIGDKFGFRVSAMQMPHEHFMKVTPRSEQSRSA
ncbi:MAG: FliM/FliN family flagellar motor switch protein [Planctomycetales bacterium]|nr:FliM/FliN family flagellar motor switch protein [Planctomycetales bacterium]